MKGNGIFVFYRKRHPSEAVRPLFQKQVGVKPSYNKSKSENQSFTKPEESARLTQLEHAENMNCRGHDLHNP